MILVSSPDHLFSSENQLQNFFFSQTKLFLYIRDLEFSEKLLIQKSLIAGNFFLKFRGLLRKNALSILAIQGLKLKPIKMWLNFDIGSNVNNFSLDEEVGIC